MSYSLTIKGLKNVDDKTVILCALLSEQARYMKHASELVDSPRVSVQKLAQSYRDDAARIGLILDSLYNARIELESL